MDIEMEEQGFDENVELVHGNDENDSEEAEMDEGDGMHGTNSVMDHEVVDTCF